MENEKRAEQTAVNKRILEFHAEFYKAFSSPKRLEILYLLKEGEMTVSEITNKLGPNANVSRHLALVRMIGIVTARRNGKNIYYRIANKRIAEACGLMQGALADLMEGVSVKSKKEVLSVMEGDDSN